MKNSILAFAFILFAQNIASSQEIENGNLNTWFLLFSRADINDSFSFTNELHFRTGSFLTDPGQILIRPSIDFHLNKDVEFSLGYTFIHTEPYSPYNQPKATNENNIWWQAWIKNKVGKTILQHRFRQEHRWTEKVELVNGESQNVGTDFSNRFRYRFVVIFNLIKLKKPDQAIIGVLFDEIWLNQKDNLLFTDIDRNWLYGGVGYKFNKDTNIQLAFMFQSDKIGPDQFINSPIIQIGFFKSFPFGHDE